MTRKPGNAAVLLSILLLAVACGQRSEAPAPGTVSPAPAPAAMSGKTIFETRCGFCHGMNGAGDTAMASGYPGANLSDGTWVHGGTPAEIEKAIADGVPGTPMAGFAGRMPPAEIKAVAEYVKSLGK